MYRHPNTIDYPRYVTISQAPEGHYRVHRETRSRYDAIGALRTLRDDPTIPYMYVYDRQNHCRILTIGTEG